MAPEAPFPSTEPEGPPSSCARPARDGRNTWQSYQAALWAAESAGEACLPPPACLGLLPVPPSSAVPREAPWWRLRTSGRLLGPLWQEGALSLSNHRSPKHRVGRMQQLTGPPEGTVGSAPFSWIPAHRGWNCLCHLPGDFSLALSFQILVKRV